MVDAHILIISQSMYCSVYGHMHAHAHVWKPEVNISVFLFHPWFFFSFYMPTLAPLLFPSPAPLPPTIPHPIHSSEGLKLPLGNQQSLVYRVKAVPSPSPLSKISHYREWAPKGQFMHKSWSHPPRINYWGIGLIAQWIKSIGCSSWGPGLMGSTHISG